MEAYEFPDALETPIKRHKNVAVQLLRRKITCAGSGVDVPAAACLMSVSRPRQRERVRQPRRDNGAHAYPVVRSAANP